MLKQLRAKVRDHVEAAQRTSASARLTELFDLESQLSAWSSALPPALAYSRRSLYEQIVVHQRPVFILVHAMFFQCRMVLHSSLVPKFGGLPSAGSIPSQAISMGAQISVQMAQKISELGIDVLALDVDPTEIASFVGYCLYGSASIHMTFSASSDPSLASSARANMMSNLKLVRSMKVYWSNLERLVRTILLHHFDCMRSLIIKTVVPAQCAACLSAIQTIHTNERRFSSANSLTSPPA